jgi:hypothetical protein
LWRSTRLTQKQEVASWRELFDLCMLLYARTFNRDDSVIIKGNDLCNVMGDRLLAHDPRSRVVFLSTNLRTFLLSSLKNPNRRAWVEQRVGSLHRRAERFPHLSGIDPNRLNAAQRSVYLWSLNQAIAEALSQKWGRDRVITLDGDAVSETPDRAVRLVAEFFGLAVSDQQVGLLVNHPTASRYSKFKGSPPPYDALTRRKDFANWEDEFGKEADGGIRWASEVLEIGSREVLG